MENDIILTISEKTYKCDKGHIFKANAPFIVTFNAGEGSEVIDIQCCQYCLADSLRKIAVNVGEVIEGEVINE